MSAGSAGLLVLAPAAFGVGVAVLGGVAAGAACSAVVGGTLGAIGQRLERSEERHRARERRELDWNVVLGEVARRNVRIQRLRGSIGPSSEPTGPAPALPEPIVLRSQSRAELVAWCSETDAVLAAVDAQVIKSQVDTLLTEVSDRLERDVAVVFRRHEIAVDPARAIRWDPLSLAGDVQRIFERLPTAASTSERARVVEAAETVLNRASAGEAMAWLDELRLRVRGANESSARRAADAEEAAALLQPVLLLGAEQADLRAELESVIASDRPLDGQLRDRAIAAALDLKQRADQRYILTSVQEVLSELGFVATEGFETGRPKNGRLMVTRPEWSAHGVRVLVDDEDHQLRAVVVRTATESSWDEHTVDQQREQSWCDTLPSLAAKLAERGITYTLDPSPTPPGARSSLLLPKERRSPGPQAQARKRSR